MFRGCYEHNIDEKGRVSIPSSFRKVLIAKQDERLIVTKFILNSFRCLDVYPYAEWEHLEQELVKKPRFDETSFKIETFYLANAQECPVDKQGRILLPPLLREYAGLQKEVMFAAALTKFRIWDKALWYSFNAESEKEFAANPNLFNGLNA
ncbi:MAG: division/cell wall cluster transcriptional repressor MraZ [Candidatus Binatia bacterium]